MSNIIGRVVVVVILLFLGALADAVRLGGPDDPDHFRSSSKFNCSDPRGLPCKEVYALLDVINGLQLPDTTSINSRQKCNVTTKSISITCSCTLLEGIQVCHVTQITTNALDLSDGIIHENVSFLPYLEHLDLAVNGLHCNIPHSLGSLKALKKLYLYNNFLRGPIPQSLGNLASLEFLDLSRNMLSGEIPKELGKLGNLISMNLEENQLVGNLPREFGDLIKLQTLDLGSNYLNGVLPDTFHNISSIQEFDIGGNNFHGRIPNFFSKWINLTTLDLRGNEFEGSLPSEIFQMSNLESLYVSDLNNTREPLVIPSESNLTTLDLSFNNLNGSIPNALRNVSEIVLTGNMLSGQIPAWINEKSESTDISYNDLPMPHNRTIPANISPNRNYTTDAKKRQCDSLDYKLFINCGGEKQSYEDKEYEQDTSMERFYESPKKKWGYTCSGNFQSESIESMNSSNYIKNKTCGVTDAGLQETARLCPVSLTYYAFCLHNGNYLVKLQFAEIVFAMDQDYSSRGKRVFDVYIQGRKN